ncbi:hypothetical protein RBA41_33035 [Massilia sp. CCM 9210]|uniref:hypothetical protein n=1 Tax=Massilia scottii TaxID=3057166 RepID=UPI0027966E1E|nr:hypothetical protein [Massilia sp. CCM 9210]MDQ1818135.1 hypothetical protein [Massilia sp. CCM 9210]
MLTNDEYDKYFRGFYIYDCAVRSRTAFSFLAVEAVPDSNASDKRLLSYFTDEPAGKNLGMRSYTGFAGARLAASTRPKEQAIMVSRDCAVGVLGGGAPAVEASIPHGNSDMPLYTSMNALSAIDGMVYAVGPWRAVCRRLGADQWESVADRKTLPVPERNTYGTNNDGFHAIDGFNTEDIYCGGGQGDLWRLDGKRWHHCPLPTNMVLENICCGGDGLVYIGMQNGSVLRGRESNWELIYKGTLSIPFKDMAWFDNRVWCTSDHGIWTIENGKLIEPDLPAEVRACSGSLAIGDGVMLLAGRYGATVYDGSSWTSLITATFE